MKIDIINVKKSYGKKQVLMDITLTVESGKCVSILGANGCGKSTLLSILAGMQKADGGQFLCDNTDLFSDSKSRVSHISYVPQRKVIFCRQFFDKRGALRYIRYM